MYVCVHACMHVCVCNYQHLFCQLYLIFFFSSLFSQMDIQSYIQEALETSLAKKQNGFVSEEDIIRVMKEKGSKNILVAKQITVLLCFEPINLNFMLCRIQVTKRIVV